MDMTEEQVRAIFLISNSKSSEPVGDKVARQLHALGLVRYTHSDKLELTELGLTAYLDLVRDREG
jgi:Mn-dependent DtxR family transcriptional regulator